VDLDGKGKRVTYNVLQPIEVRLEHHVSAVSRIATALRLPASGVREG
jgi:hypothetical protein